MATVDELCEKLRVLSARRWSSPDADMISICVWSIPSPDKKRWGWYVTVEELAESVVEKKLYPRYCAAQPKGEEVFHPSQEEALQAMIDRFQREYEASGPEYTPETRVEFALPDEHMIAFSAKEILNHYLTFLRATGAIGQAAYHEKAVKAVIESLGQPLIPEVSTLLGYPNYKKSEEPHG